MPEAHINEVKPTPSPTPPDIKPSRTQTMIQASIQRITEQIATLILSFETATYEQNEALANDYLARINQNRQQIESLQACLKTLNIQPPDQPSPVIPPQPNPEPVPESDLPILTFPEPIYRPAYGLERSFIERFEKLIENRRADWKRLLLACAEPKEASWIERCESWEEAKEMVNREFMIRDSLTKVFTMRMDEGESIGGYGERFMKHLKIAQLDSKDLNVVNRFMLSLPNGLQQEVTFIWTMKKDGWGVEDLIRVSERNTRLKLAHHERAFVFQTDPVLAGQVYEEYSQNLNRKRRGEDLVESDKRHDYKKSKPNYPTAKKPEKTFYCRMHKQNNSHDTRDCFTVKEKKQIAPCRKCGHPFKIGHMCEDKPN